MMTGNHSTPFFITEELPLNFSQLFTNQTHEGTLILDERDRSDVPAPLRTVVITFVSVAIVISNLVNLLVLRLTDQIPAIARTCLLNLSFADFMVGVVACLPCIYPAITGVWIYGVEWCQLGSITHGTSVAFSIYSLSLISIDRYLAIIHPLRYNVLMTPTRCYIAIAIMWTISFLSFAVPVFLKPNFIHYSFSASEMMCGLYWENPWACVAIAFYCPIYAGSVLLFTTVSMIRAVLKMRKVHVAPQVMPQAQTGGKTGGKISNSDLKAVKLLIVTTIVYFTMWGPHVTMEILLSLTDLFIPNEFRFASTWIGNSNSFMNVIIYSAMYKSFRKNCVWLVRYAIARLTCHIPPDRPKWSDD